MIYKKELKIAYQKLKNKNIKTSALDAELLLSFVIKKPREYILAHPEIKLTKRQFEKYNNLIKQRAKQVPIAYLTKQKEFYGQKFYVDERVLVPRPETEIIVDEVLCHCEESRALGTAWQSKNSKDSFSASWRIAMTNIIDIGTGSGCIIITLAKELDGQKNIKFFATDISKDALTVARKNARLHGVNKKINFLDENLLKPILSFPDLIGESRNSTNIKNIIITANLPYLTPAEIKNSPSIKHEPKLALVAGKDGLKYYRELAKQVKQLYHCEKGLKTRKQSLSARRTGCPKITLICEIGETQGKEMKKIFSFAKSIKIKKDLAGLDRIAIIKIFYLT